MNVSLFDQRFPFAFLPGKPSGEGYEPVGDFKGQILTCIVSPLLPHGNKVGLQGEEIKEENAQRDERFSNQKSN